MNAPQSNVAYPVIAIVDTGLWSGFDDFAGYLDDESATARSRRLRTRCCTRVT